MKLIIKIVFVFVFLKIREIPFQFPPLSTSKIKKSHVTHERRLKMSYYGKVGGEKREREKEGKSKRRFLVGVVQLGLLRDDRAVSQPFPGNQSPLRGRGFTREKMRSIGLGNFDEKKKKLRKAALLGIFRLVNNR